MKDWNTIKGILNRYSVTDEEVEIETSEGLWKFRAEGDCCAEAYIHEPDTAKDDLDRIVGEVILSASVSRPRKIDVDEGQVRDINFYTISTKHDTAIITLYTEHNGYYSGRLEPV